MAKRSRAEQPLPGKHRTRHGDLLRTCTGCFRLRNGRARSAGPSRRLVGHLQPMKNRTRSSHPLHSRIDVLRLWDSRVWRSRRLAKRGRLDHSLPGKYRARRGCLLRAWTKCFRLRHRRTQSTRPLHRLTNHLRLMKNRARTSHALRNRTEVPRTSEDRTWPARLWAKRRRPEHPLARNRHVRHGHPLPSRPGRFRSGHCRARSARSSRRLIIHLPPTNCRVPSGDALRSRTEVLRLRGN